MSEHVCYIIEIYISKNMSEHLYLQIHMSEHLCSIIEDYKFKNILYCRTFEMCNNIETCISKICVKTTELRPTSRRFNLYMKTKTRTNVTT